MKRLVRRFNRDDKASIAHALMHLETNKIADDDYPGHSGGRVAGQSSKEERQMSTRKELALHALTLAKNRFTDAAMNLLTVYRAYRS